MSVKLYKVGDKVKIRSDLKEGCKYWLSFEMIRHKIDKISGKILTIWTVRHDISNDSGSVYEMEEYELWEFYFTNEMIECEVVEKSTGDTEPTFDIGDIVFIKNMEGPNRKVWARQADPVTGYKYCITFEDGTKSYALWTADKLVLVSRANDQKVEDPVKREIKPGDKVRGLYRGNPVFTVDYIDYDDGWVPFVYYTDGRFDLLSSVELIVDEGVTGLDTKISDMKEPEIKVGDTVLWLNDFIGKVIRNYYGTCTVDFNSFKSETVNERELKKPDVLPKYSIGDTVFNTRDSSKFKVTRIKRRDDGVYFYFPHVDKGGAVLEKFLIRVSEVITDQSDMKRNSVQAFNRGFAIANSEFKVGDIVKIRLSDIGNHYEIASVGYSGSVTYYSLKCFDTVGWTTYFYDYELVPVGKETTNPSNQSTMSDSNFVRVPDFIQDSINNDYFTKGKINEIANHVKKGKKASKDIDKQVDLLKDTQSKIEEVTNNLLVASGNKDIEAVEEAIKAIESLEKSVSVMEVDVVKE